MSRMALLGIAGCLLLACSGGGNEEENGNGNGGNGDCVEKLAGCEAPVCIGNYVRSCTEDGLHYVYNLCYGQTCKNGLCQPAACTEPGKTTCTGPTTYDQCLVSMTQMASKECAAGSMCIVGGCVASECKAGSKECGWQTVLTCKDDGKGWGVQECGADQLCDPIAKACVDIDPFCMDSPLGARCQDLAVKLQCEASGRLTPAECPKKEVCVDGFCQPKACGVTYSGGPGSDVVEDDGRTPGDDILDVFGFETEETVLIDLPPKDIPPLEKPAKCWVTITGGNFDGQKMTFTAGKNANYVFKDKDLQISMAKGQHLLEVHFQGIEEGVVGSFSSDEPGSVAVMILFNDGTTDQTQIQWKYTSTAYSAVLDQFDPPGGRAIGTFAATLQDGTGGPALELTDGFFDVPRKE
ncbi:MAG: hypothetical protein FJ109_02120 [Deltaproteobacteria bacterium]|nr:hypothetical protein [Deltaproteobacteria bacterium]